MALTLTELCAHAGRAADQLTRRDIARGLLTVPAQAALGSLPELRRGLTAAGNPLSRAFWDHAEAMLTRIMEGHATIGEVRRWIQASGSEPIMLVAGGFLWPEEEERGPVAREMHALLVTHLEQLVETGAVDPDRLLAGEHESWTAYEQAQEQWLKRPLPDGREPIWAVTDEDDEEFLAGWDAADADAWEMLTQLLAPLGPRPCPEDELQAACARLRERLPEGGWGLDLLRAAGGVDPERLPSDDRELWLALAAGVAEPQGTPEDDEPGIDIDEEDLQGFEGEAYGAWLALDHYDWVAAILHLARGGPGSPVDDETLARYAVSVELDDELDVVLDVDLDDELDELDELDDELGEDAETAIAMGFQTAVMLWELLGAVDDNGRLTKLGWWGIPESVMRAYQPRDQEK